MNAEGDELGLVVVGGQLLAYVGEAKAQHGDEQVQAGVDQQPPVVAGVAGQGRDLGVIGVSAGSGVGGHGQYAAPHDDCLEHRDECHEDVGPMVADPEAVGPWEASGHLEDADDVERAHGDAGDADGEAEREEGLEAEARGDHGRPCIRGDHHVCHQLRRQHQEAHGPPSRANHGRLKLPPEDYRDGQGAEEAQGSQHDHSGGGCLMPFKEGQLPLEAGGVFPAGPLVTWAGLAVEFTCKSPQQLPSAEPAFSASTSTGPALGQATAGERERERELRATNAH